MVLNETAYSTCGLGIQVTSKGGWGCDKFARFGSKAELPSLVYRLPKRQIPVLPPSPECWLLTAWHFPVPSLQCCRLSEGGFVIFTKLIVNPIENNSASEILVR